MARYIKATTPEYASLKADGYEAMLTLLKIGRVDAVSGVEPTIRHAAQLNGIQLSQQKQVLQSGAMNLYTSPHPHLSQQNIETLKDIIQTLKQDGTLKRIADRYIPGWYSQSK